MQHPFAEHKTGSPNTIYKYTYRFGTYTSITTDADFVLGLLHCVVVGDDADVSVAHAASIFMVEVTLQ
jgi:hypothetical protein